MRTKSERIPVLQRLLRVEMINVIVGIISIGSLGYMYNKKKMFLTNIAGDYTKKVVKVLNEEMEGVPMFRI